MLCIPTAIGMGKIGNPPTTLKDHPQSKERDTRDFRGVHKEYYAHL